MKIKYQRKWTLCYCGAARSVLYTHARTVLHAHTVPATRRGTRRHSTTHVMSDIFSECNEMSTVCCSSELGEHSRFSWTVRGSIPGVGDIFRTRPNWSWSPHRLLCSGYRVFTGGKAAGAWR